MERELLEENMNKILNCMIYEIGLGILYFKFYFAVFNLKFFIVLLLSWIFLIRVIKLFIIFFIKGR